MHRFRTLVLVSLAACGHEPAPGESVDEVCIADKHRTEVAFSGYFVPPVITIGCEESCSFFVATRRDDTSGIYVTVPVGTGARTMNEIRPIEGGFPGQVERLDASDYVLRDDGGSEVGPGDVVRMTGELWFREADGRKDCSVRNPTSITAL